MSFLVFGGVAFMAGAGAVPDILLPTSAGMSVDSTGTLTRYAGIRFQNTGQLQKRYLQGSYLNLSGWMDPLDEDFNAAFDVRCTPTQGNPNYGSTVNSWLNLSVTREWGLVQSTVGGNQTIVTIEVRLTSTQEVLETRTGVDWTVFRTS